MSKTRAGLSKERWAYLKALRPPEPRMIFLSAALGWDRQQGFYVIKPGNTYRKPKA